MSVLIQAMCWTTLILGIFLVYNLLRSVLPFSNCEYNIGCYLVPHSLNHTLQIKGRLEAVQSIHHQSKSFAYQYRSIISNQTDFNSKALKVAKSFERYVKQFTEQQDYRLQDREILNGVNQAEESYLTCKKQVESNAIKSGCLTTWKQYQQCFESIDGVHLEINSLLNKQKEIQRKIKSEIQQPKEPDPESRPEIIAQKIYNESMVQNENALKILKDRLVLAEYKLRSAKEQKQKSEDRVISKEHSYNECWQNRRIYKHCEEITQQVKTLSTGTLKQLKEQIQAKQRLLQEMQQMIIRMGKGQTRKMPQHWNQMYQEHLKELKQMMVDYIQNEQIQRKACGCSQQEERLLAHQLEKERNNIQQLTIQISNAQAEVKSIRQSINLKQTEKEKIIGDYQKALKDNQIRIPPQSESHLIKIKKELEQNRQKVLKKENDYKSIEEKCQVIKQKLSSLLFDLNKVEECISKKDYLVQLRTKTLQYRHPDRSLVRLMQTKRQLAQALSSFEYF